MSMFNVTMGIIRVEATDEAEALSSFLTDLKDEILSGAIFFVSEIPEDKLNRENLWLNKQPEETS